MTKAFELRIRVNLKIPSSLGTMCITKEEAFNYDSYKEAYKIGKKYLGVFIGDDNLYYKFTIKKEN